MPSESASTGLLVMLELGAVWPAWLVDNYPTALRRVLVQLEGEAPAHFAARAGAMAGSLFPRSAPLGLALLSCNLRSDEVASNARRELGRVLLARAARPGARLMLCTAEHASERSKRALVQVATELDRGRGLEARVSVRFRSELRAPLASLRVA